MKTAYKLNGWMRFLLIPFYIPLFLAGLVGSFLVFLGLSLMHAKRTSRRYTDHSPERRRSVITAPQASMMRRAQDRVAGYPVSFDRRQPASDAG